MVRIGEDAVDDVSKPAVTKFVVSAPMFRWHNATCRAASSAGCPSGHTAPDLTIRLTSSAATRAARGSAAARRALTVDLPAPGMPVMIQVRPPRSTAMRRVCRAVTSSARTSFVLVRQPTRRAAAEPTVPETSVPFPSGHHTDTRCPSASTGVASNAATTAFA